MTSKSVSQGIGLIARLVTGGVWILAGALKLPRPDESVRAVRAYDLLPEAIVPTVGHLLPVLEVVVGVCLVLGLLTRLMGAVSALLFVAFIVGIAAAWARGMEIECGCFGGGGRLDGASEKYPGEIARDVGLLALSLWLVVRPRTRWALDSLLFVTTDEEKDADVQEGKDRRAVQG
ncbi:DoxX family protein [Nocardioides gansuensis]|uniref:DoxX family protein n=1 Tax=Nocardioides gansuensis TaxID=2138300 RepID=A0A2T8F5R5_9ACTN|nr:MauE/DoxX family redox-associated membrane protein [Nocardioides gansuensis]PVG81032.1 DoxX family protein [Nocardioides gansuensis]